MKWSEKHEIFLCREIIFMKPYQFKAGSPQSGNAWKNIASDLCEVKEIAFSVNQKSVRDRYWLLSEKHKEVRAQEGSSESNTDETELDQLLQNIMEESQEASENYEKDTKDKYEKGLKDRKDDEEVPQKALESLSQTKKWHTEDEEQSQSSNSRRRPKKSGSETMLYLHSKAEKEFDLRKEELKMKKEEMELQKELLQLKAAQKQASATENMVKMLEHFHTQQVNVQQQMLQQQQQYQTMMQQQSQHFLSIIQRLSIN